jgi:hypothetical protein
MKRRIENDVLGTTSGSENSTGGGGGEAEKEKSDIEKSDGKKEGDSDSDDCSSESDDSDDENDNFYDFIFDFEKKHLIEEFEDFEENDDLREAIGLEKEMENIDVSNEYKQLVFSQKVEKLERREKEKKRQIKLLEVEKERERRKRKRMRHHNKHKIDVNTLVMYDMYFNTENSYSDDAHSFSHSDISSSSSSSSSSNQYNFHILLVFSHLILFIFFLGGFLFFFFFLNYLSVRFESLKRLSDTSGLVSRISFTSFGYFMHEQADIIKAEKDSSGSTFVPPLIPQLEEISEHILNYGSELEKVIDIAYSDKESFLHDYWEYPWINLVYFDCDKSTGMVTYQTNVSENMLSSLLLLIKFSEVLGYYSSDNGEGLISLHANIMFIIYNSLQPIMFGIKRMIVFYYYYYYYYF